MYTKTERTTIKKVASVAGVSTQTVSRVINNRPDVSSETRKHIQEVIEKLGYQPSALARSLIHQRSYTLGVVTAGLKFIGPSQTLSGIASVAEEAGYSYLTQMICCPYFKRCFRVKWMESSGLCLIGDIARRTAPSPLT